MKIILVFGAGKSATCLISYLVRETAAHDWRLVVAETNLSLAESKIGPPSANAMAVAVQVEDEQAREALVKEADIVISLLPPSLHFLVAGSCIRWKKDLLTASYLDDKIKALEPAIRAEGLLFLCEMGLDPGIDHMSAMQLIHRIHVIGGKILSFRSHTGGLVAPDSDDNPWHYKISWNPRNVVMAGSAGASYKEQGQLKIREYRQLFENNEELDVEGLHLAWYPNRDSLSYIPIYGLEEAGTFIRTTLRYPAFCRGWKSIVAAGLTNDQSPCPSPSLPASTPSSPLLTFATWSTPILPFVNKDNRAQMEFLGLFDSSPVPAAAKTSADILQHLLETRLAMRPDDKDMIVMLHEIEYSLPSDPQHSPAPSALTNPQHSAVRTIHHVRSSLVVKGQDSLHTAMATTVGLPLGIAAKLILEGKIGLKGLHIPILPGIYEPVLAELAVQGVRFKENASE